MPTLWEGIGEKEMTNEEMQAEIARLAIELMKYALCERLKQDEQEVAKLMLSARNYSKTAKRWRSSDEKNT